MYINYSDSFWNIQTCLNQKHLHRNHNIQVVNKAELQLVCANRKEISTNTAMAMGPVEGCHSSKCPSVVVPKCHSQPYCRSKCQ